MYFRLDADRRPLLSQMLGAAIISDLVTLSAACGDSGPDSGADRRVRRDRLRAVAGCSAAHARPAISLVLGTQELADLQAAGEGLREQTLGNVAALIAHRQNVPESAELIAEIAGTQPVWITTEQTEAGWLGTRHSGKGSRRRGQEFHIHPNRSRAA